MHRRCSELQSPDKKTKRITAKLPITWEKSLCALHQTFMVLRAVIAIFWICYLVYNKLLTSAQEHKCPKCYEDDIPSAEFETNSISRWITVQSLKKVRLFKCLRWVHFFWKFFDIFKSFYGIFLWAPGPDPIINSF